MSAPSAGRAVSINFVGDDGGSMGAAESAGVVAKVELEQCDRRDAQHAAGAHGRNRGRDGTTVTWSADNLWNTPIADQAGNRRMMKGYLDTGFGGTTTVTVAGLPAGAYDVYVYVDGDNGGASRTGGYRISGAGITTTTINLTDAANTNFNATFTEANNSTGNFVKFSITASGFTLTATPGATSRRNDCGHLSTACRSCRDRRLISGSVRAKAAGAIHRIASAAFGASEGGLIQRPQRQIGHVLHIETIA